MKWFQYRIVNCILGTKKFLFKIKIEVNDKCRLCGMEEESIGHLFYECIKTKHLIQDITNWIKLKTGYDLKIDLQLSIFGYLVPDANFIPINHIFLIVKYYIFNCALNNRVLKFLGCKVR